LIEEWETEIEGKEKIVWLVTLFPLIFFFFFFFFPNCTAYLKNGKKGKREQQRTVAASLSIQNSRSSNQ
jgi:hypothetical protein